MLDEGDPPAAVDRDGTEGPKPAPIIRRSLPREPKRTPLRRILDENPQAAPRIRRAVAALLVGSGHASRDGRPLRSGHPVQGELDSRRLSPPRPVVPLESPETTKVVSIMTDTKASFRPHERLKDPKDFRRAFDRRRSNADDILIVYGVTKMASSTRDSASRWHARKFGRRTLATISSGWWAKRSGSARWIYR